MSAIGLILSMIFYAGVGALLRYRLSWGRVAGLAILFVGIETGVMLLALAAIGHLPATLLLGVSRVVMASGWMPSGSPDAWLFAILPVWILTSFASIALALAIGWKAALALIPVSPLRPR